MFTGIELQKYLSSFPELGYRSASPESFLEVINNSPKFLKRNPTVEAKLAIALIFYALCVHLKKEAIPAETRETLETLDVATEILLKDAIELQKHHSASNDAGIKYRNQIHSLLGRIYARRAKAQIDKHANQIQAGALGDALASVALDDASEYQYLAMQHFQALNVDFNPDEIKKKKLYIESRLSIIELNNEASAHPNAKKLIDDRAFLSLKHLVKNDINALVAAIEVTLVDRNEQCLKLLAPYIDIDDLINNKTLTFKDKQLSLEQVYKITRICRGKQLINDQNYLDILWLLESQVENSKTQAGSHLRKKVRYQLLTTMNALYKTDMISLDGFNALYTKFKANELGYRLALMAGDNKAKNVKEFFEQVYSKGLVPLQKERRTVYFAREYTPIVGPIEHLVNTFSAVSPFTRAIAKWPLLVLGSVLDCVLIVPLLAKLLRGAVTGNMNWGKSWFAGLFGHILGNIVIGISVGAILSLALTAVIYPIRLIGGLINRGIESYERWSAERAAKKQNPEAFAQKSLFEPDRINQYALDKALKAGIELQQKPAGNTLQGKEFKRYDDGSTYRQIYSFINPAPSAPPIKLGDDEDLEPTAPPAVYPDVQYYQQPSDPDLQQNPYFVPPSRNR